MAILSISKGRKKVKINKAGNIARIDRLSIFNSLLLLFIIYLLLSKYYG